MRLIDADKQIAMLKKQMEDKNMPEECVDYNLMLINALDSMQTDYDVDKVAEQIRGIMQDESIRFVQQAVNRAIKIVEGGGASE